MLMGAKALVERCQRVFRAPALGHAHPARPTATPHPARYGICCSGGGIRSASYCLGALQVMREEHVLERTTYVSAVSGGSYIASAFLTTARDLQAASDEVPAFAPGSAEERHLRNHSSYMAPDGAGKVRLVARVLSGAIWHLVLLALLALVVAWPASWLYAVASPQLAGSASGTTLANIGMWSAVSAAPLLLAGITSYEIWPDGTSRKFVLLSCLLATVLVVVPQAVLAARAVNDAPFADWVHSVLGAKSQGGSNDAAGLLSLIGGGAALTAIGGALSTFVSRRRRILLRIAAFVAGPLLVLAPVLIVVNLGAAAGYAPKWLAVWAVLLAFAVAIEAYGNLTQWSLHPFYLRRLSSAFYLRRSAATVELREPLDWRDVRANDPPDPVTAADAPANAFPRLIVCAAANVTVPGATPPGRAAMPFVFGADTIGVPGHERETAEYLPNRTPISVPASVAMSGAAVSPLMGKKTIHAVRFLMALMNVRLGVWLPNPALGMGTSAGRARPHLLLKEMLGKATLDDPFVYVTDGGHFDNLGLVELLRRGCTTVFCLDGGGDPAGSFRALGEAVALARSELQVDVNIDPSPIHPDKDTGIARQGHALGTLRFRSSPDGSPHDDGDPRGRIIYCRAAVTQDAPWDVRAFADRDKRFPYHSTMDQLFTDEKFESYRALGAHAAREAIRDWRREAVRVKVLEILCQRARERGWITYDGLCNDVYEELNAARLTSLRPLLSEIAAEEKTAGRPPLALVVQAAAPMTGDVLEQLARVYEYWAPLPPSTNGGPPANES